MERAKMKREQSYKIMRIAIGILLVFAMLAAISMRNPIAAAVIFLIGILLLKLLGDRYRDLVLKDERTLRIGEKALGSAFMIYAAGIGIGTIAIAFIEPFNPDVIDQIKPLINQLSYAIFPVFALFYLLYFYYLRKM